MTKCGKGCMPECEYFTTGGCVSLFNCPYKIEQEDIITTTQFNLYAYETDKDAEIVRLTAENERLQTENAKIDEYRCVIDDISEQCRELEAENAELRARLNKAVEFPFENLDKVFILAGEDTNEKQFIPDRIHVCEDAL